MKKAINLIRDILYCALAIFAVGSVEAFADLMYTLIRG